MGWAGVTSFLTFNIGGSGREYWSEPVYYSYGGDSIIYRDDDPIVVNDVNLGPAREYRREVVSLVDSYDRLAPASEGDVVAREWKPLGIYAISDVDRGTDSPNRYVELVVSNRGAIGGTYHDLEQGQDYAIHGAVDPETQRVAWRVSETDEIFETGIYNLTRPESNALYIGDVTKQVLLVRVQDPQAQASADTSVQP